MSPRDQTFFDFRLKDELLESRRVTKGEEIFVKQLEVITHFNLNIFILRTHKMKATVYDLSNVIYKYFSQ